MLWREYNRLARQGTIRSAQIVEEKVSGTLEHSTTTRSAGAFCLCEKSFRAKALSLVCRLLPLVPGESFFQKRFFTLDFGLEQWKGHTNLGSGIWTSVSGAMAQSQRLDTVANNLANMDTPGYKKDIPTFKEYLAHKEREAAPLEVPRGPITNREMYPLDGKEQAFVIQDATYSNFKQGNLRVTQNPLDLALDGPGFFEVSTPKGVQFTKHGSFKVSTDGRLVTSQGFPVLSSQPGGLASALPPNSVQPNQGGSSTQGGVAAGQQPTTPDQSARYINLGDVGRAVSISEDGEVYAGDQFIAKLAVTEFADPRKLRKHAGVLFQNPDPANQKPDQTETKVRQGVLETSNVNPVEEMTNLIKAHRSYEQNLKSLKAFDEITVKEANDVGKL